jgi:hypothetical protein
MSLSVASGFYHVGGTMLADSPSYISRHADDELLRRTLDGDYCYVLTPRQMGKSSLMVRTSAALQQHGVRTVIIDLQNIVQHDSDAEQFFGGVAFGIAEALQLAATMSPPDQDVHLSGVQRFSNFMRQVARESEQPIVIFLDEIDATTGFDYNDDFFAAVRAIHNARATDESCLRLTFVLLGCASPVDLIADAARSPFNVGRRIVLTDFTREEAMFLAKGLSPRFQHPEAALHRIYD